MVKLVNAYMKCDIRLVVLVTISQKYIEVENVSVPKTYLFELQLCNIV